MNGYIMKPFDLEKALAGEPVELINGSKAILLLWSTRPLHTRRRRSKITFPLIELYFTKMVQLNLLRLLEGQRVD